MKVKIDVDLAVSALRKKKKYKDVTISSIAEMVGVTDRTLTNFKNGKSCGQIETITKLSDLTGVPIKKLIIKTQD